ncbi:hypothetical protein [Thalassotalea aquiviva]|uniref:hypothetical protein n=1 Tax=Thalassotalea aquiviva TaxID=3242415 RepID=UPI00352A842B
MKYLFLVTIILVSGCSSQPMSHQIAEVILGKIFEKTTNKDMSYNAASCRNVKRSCSSGHYQEWFQQNGKKACACNSSL